MGCVALTTSDESPLLSAENTAVSLAEEARSTAVASVGQAACYMAHAPQTRYNLIGCCTTR